MPTPAIIPVADIFSAAIDILQDRSKFCQRYYYTDKYGIGCNLSSAASFDASGVIQHIIHNSVHEDEDEENVLLAITDNLMREVFYFMYGQSVPLVNDLPDGYEKVMSGLALARYLWQDREPDDIDLHSSVEDLLEKINESEML